MAFFGYEKTALSLETPGFSYALFCRLKKLRWSDPDVCAPIADPHVKGQPGLPFLR